MSDCKPVKTPATPDAKLTQREENDVCNQKTYQAACSICLVQILPLIAVSRVARFCAKPTNEHWTAVKRILRCLKGTSNFGLLYDGSASSACAGYSDADRPWAGDVADKRLLLAMCFCSEVLQLAGRAVSNLVLLCPQLRQSMWHSLQQPGKQCGFNNWSAICRVRVFRRLHCSKTINLQSVSPRTSKYMEEPSMLISNITSSVTWTNQAVLLSLGRHDCHFYLLQALCNHNHYVIIMHSRTFS